VGLARVLDNVTHHSNVMEWVRSHADELILSRALIMQQAIHCAVGVQCAFSDCCHVHYICHCEASVLTPHPDVVHDADLRLCGAGDASEPAGMHVCAAAHLRMPLHYSIKSSAVPPAPFSFQSNDRAEVYHVQVSTASDIFSFGVVLQEVRYIAGCIG
jgi:hypothetical protein